MAPQLYNNALPYKVQQLLWQRVNSANTGRHGNCLVREPMLFASHDSLTTPLYSPSETGQAESVTNTAKTEHTVSSG